MFDDLKIYRGCDIPVTSKIIVKQPRLQQIVDFGEKEYFYAIYTLISVGADLKWQLWEKGIDYTEIEDYELFYSYIWQQVGSKKKIIDELSKTDEGKQLLDTFSQEDLNNKMINPLQLVLNIDLGDFELYKEEKENQPINIILYDKEHDITIDKVVYTRMVDLIRKIHGFKRNNEMPANEATKRDLIEDARDEAFANQNKEYKSVLRPLISYLKTKSGSFGREDIWNMKINEFFYDIKKSGSVKETELLLQGAYSGFSSLKGISNKKLDWFADVNE